MRRGRRRWGGEGGCWGRGEDLFVGRGFPVGVEIEGGLGGAPGEFVKLYVGLAVAL